MLRTLFILGRVSNLPTVWSNLLAGWLIVESFDPIRFAPLLMAGSFLYIGGMYLNDFCDAAFDAVHCPQRPIPAGKISRKMVGTLSAVWFCAGLGCAVFLGVPTLVVAVTLIGVICWYDLHHKNVPWAPLVMGGCRFLLYALAASTAVGPGTSWSMEWLWHPCLLGVTTSLYVAGITWVARGESRPEKPARWALGFLLLPVVVFGTLAILYPFRWKNVALGCLVFLGWLAWLLVPLWRKTKPSIGRVVSGLLAGIVLVDALAYSSLDFYALFFLPFFLLALLLQRYIPAT